MKTLALSAIALSTALGFADGAQAQQAKKLFFEGDIVRHALADQAGPFCVLANQFKRKEAIAWRIRVLEPTGGIADNNVLKSVVVELGNGQKLLVAVLDHPGRFPDRIAGLQGGRHHEGRLDRDLGAVHQALDAAYGDLRRACNEDRGDSTIVDRESQR
jgi:hypothetical protein